MSVNSEAVANAGAKARSKYSLKTDVRCLKPIHVICNYLGTIPNFNNELSEDGDNGYLYAVFASLVYLAIYGYGAAGKFVYIADKLDPTMRLVDIVLDFSLMVACILSVVGTNIIYRKDLLKFWNDFRKIDEEVAELQCSLGYLRIKFYAELVIVHLYFIVYYAYYTYTWVGTLGLNIFKYYMLRDLQIYNILMFSMLLRNYALAIKYRYEALNHVLCQYSKYNGECRTLTSGMSVYKNSASNGEPKRNWNMIRVKKIYTDISQVLDQYNELFGWNFVTIYVNIVIIFLGPVNIAIIHGSGGKKIDGATFGWELITLCLIWGGLSFILGWAIFSACDQGASEATKIPKACYMLMQDLTKNGKDFQFHEELRDLAQHSTNRRPQFIAAGFFVVNYSVVFTLIGSISSYLIVLIQFNSQ